MLDALSAGLPAIVTDVGCLPELVELSGAGTVVPARDVERLARAIVDYANRRHELASLGARAADCYRSHFTPDRMAREYLTLYAACLRGGAAAAS
jgi:glycosyltransferase involved in cell wall biosynthesis